MKYYRIGLAILTCIGAILSLIGMKEYLIYSSFCFFVAFTFVYYHYRQYDKTVKRELSLACNNSRDGVMLDYPSDCEELVDLYIRNLVEHDVYLLFMIPLMVFFLSCLHIVEALMVAVIYYIHIRRQQNKIRAFYEDTVIRDKACLKLNRQGVSFVSYKIENAPKELDFCKWSDIRTVKIYRNTLVMTSNDEIYLGAFRNRQEITNILGTCRRFT